MSALCLVDGAPATEGNLCTPCSQAARADVARAPARLEDADETTAKQSQQVASENGAVSSSRALVYNVAASDAARELRGVLLGMAITVSTHLDSVRVTDSDQVVADRVLAGWPSVTRRDDVAEVVARLASASAEAVRVVDSAPERRVIGVCDCGAQLVTSRREGQVACRRPGCDAVFSIEEWEAFRWVQVVDRVVTASEAAGLFRSAFRVKLTAEVVWQWVRRRHLHRVVGEDGREGVRVGDVIATYEALRGPLPGRPTAQARPTRIGP